MMARPANHFTFLVTRYKNHFSVCLPWGGGFSVMHTTRLAIHRGVSSLSRMMFDESLSLSISFSLSLSPHWSSVCCTVPPPLPPPPPPPTPTPTTTTKTLWDTSLAATATARIISRFASSETLARYLPTTHRGGGLAPIILHSLVLPAAGFGLAGLGRAWVLFCFLPKQFW